MDFFIYLILFVIAYLIGSISPATLLALKRGIDLNKVGSKSAGATNSMRSLGIKTGFLVLLLDFFKGWLPVFLALFYLPDYYIDAHKAALLILFAIALGHIYPLYFKFKGGKAVACLAGGVFAFIPFEALIATLVFIGILFIGRRVSLASISITIFLPSFYAYYNKNNIDLSMLLFLVFAGIFVIFTHRQNIKRLLNGTETKIF